MKIMVFDDYEKMSDAAAKTIAAQLLYEPESVLGLATGSTPIGMYKALVEMYKAEFIDFENVCSFNLDEYLGLNSAHEQSYRYFMNENLFSKVNIMPENTFFPVDEEGQPFKNVNEYDAMIDELGGIDIQVLGIGHNGHIGFNEPADNFPKFTNVVDLKQSTIEANSRFFNSIDEVPRKAVTMGIMSIFEARKIILLASGKEKAEIIEKALFGPITPEVPASILQLHPDLEVYLDEAAASGL